jgi:hypothetical protein
VEVPVPCARFELHCSGGTPRPFPGRAPVTRRYQKQLGDLVVMRLEDCPARWGTYPIRADAGRCFAIYPCPRRKCSSRKGILFPFGKSKHLDAAQPRTTLERRSGTPSKKRWAYGPVASHLPHPLTEWDESGGPMTRSSWTLAGTSHAKCWQRYSHIRMGGQA